MGTQRTARVFVRNDTGGDASILLFHNNSTNGTQRGEWDAPPGARVGPLPVYFETGFGTWGVRDYWAVMLHVRSGPAAGSYVSSGTSVIPHWKECQLQHHDADQSFTLGVSTTTFDIPLPSGGCSGGMTRIAPGSPITHVFVVMLENHSFDNVFAMSGIPGITAATTRDSNSHDGTTYHVQPSAPLSMPTDPGHEFRDVVEQLAGEHASYPSGGPYPAIDNSGFAANYATSTTEGPAPSAADIGDIMACFATPTQLPTIYQLATEFAVCDRWHSSIPGPTWPNRFFVHGASSSGLDDSPTNAQIAKWELPEEGFRYPNGSIYDSLGRAGIPHRFYRDANRWEKSIYSDDPDQGSVVGAVPQVSTLHGVTLLDFHSLERFASDLQGPYPYPYTFIEPHYGDITGGTYRGGSSQHPMDDVYGGEHLLASVYAAVRKSPYWSTSLLIVTYDEHGGFYDSVAPPPAPPPGDRPSYGYNKHGFTFDRYGVRVPAVVVSPRIPRGTVDHTVYDHSSVLKTLEELFGLPALTGRDAAARSLLHLLSLAETRTDCPATVAVPHPKLAVRPAPEPQAQAEADSKPVPDSGNLPAALRGLAKTDLALTDGSPAEMAAARARFAAVRTRADARAYGDAVLQRVAAARRAKASERASLVGRSVPGEPEVR